MRKEKTHFEGTKIIAWIHVYQPWQVHLKSEIYNSKVCGSSRPVGFFGMHAIVADFVQAAGLPGQISLTSICTSDSNASFLMGATTVDLQLKPRIKARTL